ncbi:gap junction alpha-5 protein-like [Protopterus annectens]|uniref:gap junction alpha-5 protein-like n=1 Tax=Protopterus annectens TaxID=7888 RepID=UPI001CF95F26|nr:gap junction alpha-5 protein-like [Protopterus annectens]
MPHEMAHHTWLYEVLGELQQHSTVIGKVWLTALFIIRVLVLGITAEYTWKDEQSEFSCDTLQPGCKNVCFDKVFPISHVRYWILQIIFVSIPTLLYTGHIIHTIQKEQQRKRKVLSSTYKGSNIAKSSQQTNTYQEDNMELSYNDEIHGHYKVQGLLLETYISSILFRIVLEMGFVIGQYKLYGIFLQALYVCKHWPCPQPVNCFVSRPTEKNIYIVIMLGAAGLSLFLSLAEILYLGNKRLAKYLNKTLRASPKATLEDRWSKELKLQNSPQGNYASLFYITPNMEIPNPQRNKLISSQISDNFAEEQHQTSREPENEHNINMNYAQNCSTAQLATERYYKEKHHVNRTSGLSSRTRSDDLAV